MGVVIIFTRPRHWNPVKLYRPRSLRRISRTLISARVHSRAGPRGSRRARTFADVERMSRRAFFFSSSRCHGWDTGTSIFSPWASRRTRRTRDSSRRIFLTRRTGRYKWNTLNDEILAHTSVKCPRRRPWVIPCSSPSSVSSPPSAPASLPSLLVFHRAGTADFLYLFAAGSLMRTARASRYTTRDTCRAADPLCVIYRMT